MQFLRPDRSPINTDWWTHAAAARDRPVIVGELMRDDSVVCDRPEADAAIAWARAQPGWSTETPAIWIEDPHAARIAAGQPPIPPGVAP